MQDALLAASPEDVRRFAAANPDRVVLNEERDAVQIVGRGERMVASFSLRSDE